jgi:penicillin-binding protein 1C
MRARRRLDLPTNSPAGPRRDLELQRDAEAILEAHRPRLAQQAADNAAAIIIDNDTGEVLAYLGSIDYQSGYAAQVDHVRSPRQAGSTLKPFVYALAFAHGTRAHQPLADVSKSFGSQSDSFAPDNFDHVFHGPVSAHTALASSLNVPAVGLAAGLPEGTLLRSLRRLGLDSLHEDSQHYGLSLALGSGEVSLAELSIAYAIRFIVTSHAVSTHDYGGKRQVLPTDVVRLEETVHPSLPGCSARRA